MICRIHRTHINAAIDADRPLPPGTEKHCETCAACRGYFEEHSQLARGLRESGYDGTPPEMPAFLATRIRANLSGERSTVRRSWLDTRVWPVPVFIGVAAAMLIIAGLVTLNRQIERDSEFAPAMAETTPPSNQFPDKPMSDAVVPLLDHLASNPLQTEVQLLANDAQNALSFLASNFVPSEDEKQRQL